MNVKIPVTCLEEVVLADCVGEKVCIPKPYSRYAACGHLHKQLVQEMEMIKPASYELSVYISSLPSPVTVQTALVFQEQNQGSLNLLKRTKKLDKHGCQLGRRVVGVCPRVCLQFCL